MDDVTRLPAFNGYPQNLEVSALSGLDGQRSPVWKGGSMIHVADTGPANTEFSKAHGLSHRPWMFIVLSNNKNGVVYLGTTAWDGTNIYLRHGAANAEILVVVF
jgi:hypothetical protein